MCFMVKSDVLSVKTSNIDLMREESLSVLSVRLEIKTFSAYSLRLNYLALQFTV